MSQIWITHRPAALCSCHSLNPLHASVSKQGPSSSPDFPAEIAPAEPVVTTNIDIVTGSGMNCRVTTVEGLPSSTGLNSTGQVFQHAIIGVPLPGVASSVRQDTGNQSQHECLHIPRNPTITNSTDRRISSPNSTSQGAWYIRHVRII